MKTLAGTRNAITRVKNNTSESKDNKGTESDIYGVGWEFQ